MVRCIGPTMYRMNSSTSPPSPALGRVLATVSVGFVVTQLDVTIVNIALPRIGADLHANVAGLQWVVDAYTLAFAVLMLSAGVLGDRFGARRMYAAGIVLFALASLACGLALDATMLVAARAVQGVGAAAMLPNSLALLNQSYGHDPKLRARAVGLWTAAGAIAIAAGPVAGGLLIAAFGWRSIFLVNLPICAAGLLATLLWVPRPEAATRQSPPTAADASAHEAPTRKPARHRSGRPVSCDRRADRLRRRGDRMAAAGARPPARGRRLRARADRGGRVHRRGIARRGADAAALALQQAHLQRGGAVRHLRESDLLRHGVRAESLFAARARLYAVAGGPRVPAVDGRLSAVERGERLGGRPLRRARADDRSARSPPGSAMACCIWSMPRTPLIGLLLPFLLIPSGMGLAVPAMTTAVLASTEAQRAGTASAVLNTARQAGGAVGVAAFGALASGAAADADRRGDAGGDARSRSVCWRWAAC